MAALPMTHLAADERDGSPSPFNVDIKQIRAFLALVDHGSVSRAARALGLAQSTVSEALAALDRAVGTSVVRRRRGAHRLSLTAAGEALLPHARRVAVELEEAQRAVATANTTARARIDVLTVESLSTYLLPSVLASLRREWPNTRFAVTIATCAAIREGVASGRCDLGLSLEEDSDDDASPVATDGSMSAAVLVRGIRLVVFCAPGHPLLRRPRSARMTAVDLLPFTVFVSDAGGDYYDMLRRYLSVGSLPLPRLEPTGSIEATRRCVAADDRALGILPAYAVAADVHNGLACPLPLDPPPTPLRITALLPAHERHHPAVTALLEQLRRGLAHQARAHTATVPHDTKP